MAHTLRHPNVPAVHSAWAEEQTLYVATPYVNAFRFRRRRELMNNFRHHMAGTANVELYVGEVAFGDRPFEVTEADHSYDFQWRTKDELWVKENTINLLVQRFPKDWKYGCYIDADIGFTRHDWALEAIHQLQHYDWVQLFSSYSDLDKDHRIIRTNNSFAYNYHANGLEIPRGYAPGGWKVRGGDDYCPGSMMKLADKPVHTPVGATGGAWAFRREAFEAVGGLLDRCILGHADWFMTFGLVCKDAPDMHIDGYTDDYRRYIQAWQGRASRLTGNIGYVDGYALHHYHGDKAKRGYSTRDKILVKHQYSPLTDVMPDAQGILQLNPTKPRLRDDIRRYFLSRKEDD